MGDLINAGADLLGVGPASKAAGAQQASANTQAAAQIQAAQIAADAAKFRPVGVTTGFGSSQFTTDANGNVVGAGYTLTPELQAIRNRIMGSAGQYDPTQMQAQAAALGQGANLLLQAGQGYLSASPEQARQNYINQQNALLAPQNEAALANIRNQQFQTGRTGLATGGTVAGGMQATNPEMAAYYNALANQQAQLAAGANQAAQQQQTFGAGLLGAGGTMLGQQAGLYSTSYAPLQTQLGLAGTIEGLGQGALDLGAALGGRVTAANAASGLLLGQGMTNAAKTTAAAAPLAANARAAGMSSLLSTPSLSSSNPQVQKWFNNLIGGDPYGGTAQGGYAQQDQYLAGAYANPQTQQAQMLAEQMNGF
jgi:hypothetical protein